LLQLLSTAKIPNKKTIRDDYSSALQEAGKPPATPKGGRL